MLAGGVFPSWALEGTQAAGEVPHLHWEPWSQSWVCLGLEPILSFVTWGWKSRESGPVSQALCLRVLRRLEPVTRGGGSEPQKSVPPRLWGQQPEVEVSRAALPPVAAGEGPCCFLSLWGRPSHPCLLCVSVSVCFCLLKGCLSLDSGPPDLRSFASQLQRPRCRVWGRMRAAFLGPHADHFTLSSTLPHSCRNPEGNGLPWKCEFGSFLYAVDEPDVFICWGRLAA